MPSRVVCTALNTALAAMATCTVLEATLPRAVHAAPIIATARAVRTVASVGTVRAALVVATAGGARAVWIVLIARHALIVSTGVA